MIKGLFTALAGVVIAAPGLARADVAAPSAPATPAAQPATVQTATELTAQAPDATRPRVSAGFRVGLNFATLTEEGNTGPSQLESRLAYTVGGFVSLPVSRAFAIQPELQLSQRGAQLDDDGFDDVSVVLDMKYLELNALAVATIPVRGTVKPYVYAGPSLGVLLSADVTARFDGQSETESIQDEIDDTDLGLIAGAGLDIPRGSGSIKLDLRYQHGLTNLIPDEDAQDGDAIHNRVVSMLVGYAF